MKGTNNIGKPGYREVLRDNIISWLDESFLNIGGKIDTVNVDTAYGKFNELTKLSPTQYYSRRGNWVWEPNIGSIGGSIGTDIIGSTLIVGGTEVGRAINISGVYVNDVFQTSGYSINYRDGIVTFDSPVNLPVKVNYSHKYIETFNAQENNFFRVDDESFEVHDDFFITGSGLELPKNRIQLPAIAVETINRDTRSPYEIGNTSHFRETQVLLRILSNSDSVSSRIADFITDQKETTINMFDTEKVAMSGYYPLNYDGTINFISGYHSFLSNVLPYNTIKNANVFIKDAYSEDLNYITPNLCKVTVRLNIESITK